MNNEKIKCIIVDDEYNVREAIASLLKNIEGIEILACEGIPEKAIDKVIALKPEIIFLDVEMPRMHGFEFVNQIRQRNYFPTFIFVTGYNQYAVKAIKKEAFDYLLKPVDIEELTQAIKRFKEKRIRTTLSIINKPIFAELSKREKEILDLLLQGKSSREIAEQLFISKTTVDTHRRNILEKTGAKSTLELLSLN